MEKPHRVAQVYGYTVCLVAVIAFIICIANLIPAIMDMSDPLHAGSQFVPSGTPSLASFENYKMDILKSTGKEGEKSVSEYLPDDKTLMKMYEAAKTDKIDSANHVSVRSILVNSLIIVICVILFAIHWVWMRKLMKKISQSPIGV
jgi:flagellar biogenesis protein FliO